jgi:gluconate kinase
MSFIRKKRKMSTSEKIVKNEFEKLRKLYDAYHFIYANADDEALKERIVKMAQGHLLSISDTIYYSALLSLEERREQIRKKITESSP